MAYDFSSLEHPDFEDFVRDLIGREIGARFEAFAAGPDGGIDGRHASAGDTIILQAKHYRGSRFATLKSTMRRERASVDRLMSTRYILTTSLPLSPDNKSELAKIIGPALQTEADIFGPGDLNGLLRKHPDVERAHVKLWLSSAPVLEAVVRAAAHGFTAITRDEIAAKVRVYAPNPSFAEAQAKLEDQHVLIISGPPGVGKTTLAEVLSYAYIGEDWELVGIRSLDDGFASIVDAKKQIFLFDDFLGQVALDVRALSTNDSDLARFVRRVRTSPNARFILTTRAYIFEEARRVSERLADPELNLAKYILDVGVYTRRVRARILYNHLAVSGTPSGHIAALIRSEKLTSIVDHKNYNPRVIEWMTDGPRLGRVRAADYPAAFLEALANPSRIWDTAFRTHIAHRSRHLLIALYFSSTLFGVSLAKLRLAYEPLHAAMCRDLGLPRDPKDFEESVRILEGGFIAIRGQEIGFINPSLRDYLADYLNDPALLEVCASSSVRVEWAARIWSHAGRCSLSAGDKCRIALAFLPIADQFAKLPTSGRQAEWPHVPLPTDSSNTDRLQLLLALWGASSDRRFANLALALGRKPVGGFSGWRDGRELVELARQLRDGDYFPGLPNASELSEALEDGIVAVLESGVAADDLESISNAIEQAWPEFRDSVVEACHGAIRREVSDVASLIEDMESESMLADHAELLRTLAPRAGISLTELSDALSQIENRLSEIAEDTESSSPTIRQPFEQLDQFDDDALRNLFAPLLAR